MRAVANANATSSEHSLSYAFGNKQWRGKKKRSQGAGADGEPIPEARQGLRRKARTKKKEKTPRKKTDAKQTKIKFHVRAQKQIFAPTTAQQARSTAADPQRTIARRYSQARTVCQRVCTILGQMGNTKSDAATS